MKEHGKWLLGERKPSRMASALGNLEGYHTICQDRK